MLSIIVAATLDRAIGLKGDQLYYISEDLKNFKRLTSGNTVIMGSKTFKALPKGALPNRKNIVVTHSPHKIFPGAMTIVSPQEALENIEGEGFVIGGAQIYEQFMPLVQRIYLTQINIERVDADKYFPEIDNKEWKLSHEGAWSIDTKNNIEFRFLVYDRI